MFKDPFNRASIVFCLLLIFNSSCKKSESIQKQVTVRNSLDIERTSETISISMDKLEELSSEYSAENILVKSSETEEFLVSQLLDNDQDGKADELLFQVNIGPNEEKHFIIMGKENGKELQPKSELTTYSRFVPERTDDYTWENDKVAFRTYGPEAQRMVEEGEPGGTLSSGIDLWLKRVNYSVIDKWYEGHEKEPGYYHIDHGEGYDPYHVGKSRGTGGIGVWTGDSLLVSRNFTEYKTIATGPIRTVFELSYAPWSEYQIKETKRISLDLGSNFSKFQITFSPENPVPNYTIGITLHEGNGNTDINEDAGWFRHWESMGDSYLGEGVVIDPALVDSAFVHLSDTPDQSQLLIVTSPEDNVLNYYAGFGWVKSSQVNDVEAWDEMLQREARFLANPLQVTIE